MCGDMISSRRKSFDYFDILKKNLSFQKKSENKDFLVGVVSKELSIEKNSVETVETSKIVDDAIQDPEEKLIEEKDDILLPVLETDTEETFEPVQTSVIQANNLPENYNTIYQDIKIKNETNFNLSQDILNPNVEFSNKDDIIIFHTHTCESYTPTKENNYVASRKL